MATYNMTKDRRIKNLSGFKINAKLKELGITHREIISILNKYGIMDISDDNLSYKMNGLHSISDIELMIWSTLLQCPVEELIDDSIELNSALEDARNELINCSNINTEINSLKPKVTWHPVKPDIRLSGIVKWDCESRSELIKFYNEFGMDNTAEEYEKYGISKSRLANQLSVCRKKYPDMFVNSYMDHRLSPRMNFINFYNKYGSEITAARYGLTIEKVEKYVDHINYIKSI